MPYTQIECDRCEAIEPAGDEFWLEFLGEPNVVCSDCASDFARWWGHTIRLVPDVD